MARIYRTMKREGEFPLVENSRYGLGAREPQDVQSDADGEVHPRGGGMSVMSSRFPPIVSLIPKRLKDLDPRYAGATASAEAFIFCTGEGLLEDGAVAGGLDLRVDPLKGWHGFVEPSMSVEIDVYRADLATTRGRWSVCEDGDAP